MKRILFLIALFAVLLVFRDGTGVMYPFGVGVRLGETVQVIDYQGCVVGGFPSDSVIGVLLWDEQEDGIARQGVRAGL